MTLLERFSTDDHALMNPAARARAKAKSRVFGRGPFGFSSKTWPFVKVLVGNWLFGLAYYATGRLVLTWQPAQWDSVGDRLTLVLQCAVFAILPALVAIAIVSAQRLNPDMWVGQKVKPNSALDINTRFILNTTEQFILYFIGLGAISLYADQEHANLLVILTSLFMLGRLLFWIGYHRNPYLRAFGFGLTFYPMVVVYAWLVLRIALGIAVPI